MVAGACTADAKMRTQLVFPEDYGGANLAPSVMVLTSERACKRLEKTNAFYFFYGRNESPLRWSWMSYHQTECL